MKKLIISLLLTAALVTATAAEEMRLDVATIRTLLHDGEKAQQAGDPARAISSFEAGIKLLNDSYRNPGYLDDTDQKQLAADIQKKKGNLKEAAYVYKEVLLSRLEMYETKEKLDAN